LIVISFCHYGHGWGRGKISTVEDFFPSKSQGSASGVGFLQHDRARRWRCPWQNGLQLFSAIAVGPHTPRPGVGFVQFVFRYRRRKIGSTVKDLGPCGAGALAR
jgi:hypothetical protein